MQGLLDVAGVSLRPLRRCKRRSASIAWATRRVVEALEDRTLFAWNLAIGLAPTQNVAASVSGSTITYTAVATGATLNWSDVASSLAAGNSVAISSGTSGTEAGNITDISGMQSGAIPQNLNLTFASGTGMGLVGNISLDNVLLNGSNASMTIDANGSVSTGLLSSGTSLNPTPLATVLITAANGSIGSQSSTTADPIDATTLALKASTGIGTSSAPLSTQVANLSGRTSSGDIFISNSGDVNINDGVLSGVNGLRNLASGNINLADQGTISLTNEEVSTEGQINFNASGPAADIQVDDGILTADGGVVAHADRDVVVTDGSSIMSAKSPLNVTAGRDVILNNSAQITTDFGLIANITVSAGRNLTIESTSGSKNTLIGSSGGSINLTTAPGGIFTLDAGAGGQVSNFSPYSPGNITITSDDMVINDPIYAGRNTVTLQQASTTRRDIDLGLGTTPGDLDLTSAAISQITAQTLCVGRLYENGNILLTAPVTTPLLGYGKPGTVELLSGSAIGSAGPADTLTVPNLTMQASSGIGSSTQPLETVVSVLSARTETGGVYINNSGNLSIGGGVIPSVGGIWDTTFGDIQLDDTGSVDVVSGYFIKALLGNVSVDALGAASDIQTGGNGNGSIGEGAIDAGATATLTAGRDLLVGSGSLGTGDIEGRDVVLNAGRDLILNGGTYISGEGSVTAAVGRNITLSVANDQIVSNAITLTTGLGGVLTNNGSIDSNANYSFGGNITISADDMALNGAIDADAAGIVTLEQSGTTTRNIDLGGGTTAGDLDLSNVELGEITAGVLRIGRSDNAGGINMTALLTAPSSVGILHLITGGGVSQSTNAGLDVPKLAVTAAGTVDLGDKLNNITNLAANMSGPGSAGNYLTVVNGTNSLTVASGGLDGVLGLTTNNGVITLVADGMNINAPVDAGTFWVSLQPFSSGRPITLGSKAAGSLGLTNAELDNITTSNLHIGDLNGNIEFIPIRITAPIVAPSTWSTLELFSGTDSIQQNSGASITVKNLAVTGSTGVYLTDPGNTVTNLGGSSNVSFNFVNSTSLTVADVDPSADANGIESQSGSVVNITALGGSSLLSINARITGPQGYGSIPTITLSADEIALNALVSAGPAGIVTLQQGNTTSRGIDLGGGTTAGELDLSNKELGEVVASVLRIGRADNAGNITVAAPVTQNADFPTLSLISGGAVDSTNSAGPDITATNLAVRAADGINLNTAVSSLAFQNAAGVVSILNTIALTVGQIDGLSSSYNLGGNTTLNASGPITFAEATASAGTLIGTTENASEVTINSGVIVQSTGADVDLTSGGGILLNSKSQVLAPLGNISLTSGSASVSNNASMTLSGTLSAGGNLTIDIPAGASATLTGTATAAQVIENGGGLLFVNGTTGLINADVTVNAGTLGGTGNISGTTTVESGATLATGDNAPGVLTTGSAIFSDASTFALRLAGKTPGNTATSYGQLDANGNVNLNNATLAANLTFVPALAQTFTLIQATGNISGQFAQGMFIVLNGITYSINYLPHSVVLAAQADLSVSVNGPTSVVEGSAASYTYTVYNGGPGAAQNVVLSAPIPHGAIFVSAHFGGGFSLPASAYSSTTGTVNIGTLSEATGGMLTLSVILPEENPGIKWSASIVSSTPDPNLADNSVSLTTVVEDAPLTAQGHTVSAGPGSLILKNVTVATFSDANPYATASDFTATVNWGDGTVGTAQIVANVNGTFSVIASHTYSNSRITSYPLTIQIVDIGGSTATVTGTAMLRPVLRP